MQSELVTVILPTYNRASFLRETIGSVLAQSYENFHLMICDDHSTDDTSDIIDSFRDRRIKYVRHQHNLGLVANWTFGVRSAAGRYLSVLGDDDKYDTDFLKHRIEGFRTFNDAVAVTGAFTCIDREGRPVRTSNSPSKGKLLLKGTDLTRFILGMTGEWFNGATLYKTELVQSLWRQVIAAGIALDFSLHIRLGMIPGAAVMYIPDSEMYLRTHDDQESKRSGMHLAESAAGMALQMWMFETRGLGRESLGLYRERFANDVNHYGRMLWDSGRIVAARNAFKSELSIDPLRIVTWLRMLRTYVASPRRVPDK